MFNKTCEQKEPACEVTINLNVQIVGMAVGCVLAQSENTMVKAGGVGLVAASFLGMIKKLSKL
ncbi:hypothetical protein RAY_141 [Erwinia phage vB_EamM_RAY]|uniref:Uncharacterized protein n=10 Tax=Agricanvirus TaxID=1984776 RepID=A0A173GE47_9CAUD|nr:hypothetical protein Ea357_140 [Erwinia phage Ea35-70]YP_009605289.1 hypothetical protein FDH97_gp146 [Erwinia phage vB_EamM_Deimos-Minion]YP_009605608.1 hypothetical protein FDH98_gp141 [Erwinia phage vB_EamM_RAY]YP_009605928.1 hypothetical protein FDH99_gp144 [Erwinia phage vB_EamM_Simmy50]YP_009606249.1 hypothetical protein FDI00_gp143 [Erwinia phage vB_EamM_Special G]YP_009621882.1 hypothetical protein FDJ23_gp141 [Erwinia phage vB_EamM_Desertfox]AUG85929.1 hypothetical protein BOSOLAP